MKKWTLLFLIAVMALCLTACGGKKEKEVSVDMEKLAEELLATVTSDSLTETAPDMLASIYFYEPDDVASAVAYASSGTTACEIAVIQSKDAGSTGDIEKLLQTRVGNQSDLYASYNEAEVSRLDGAIIKSAGAYTVLCVCDDPDKAEEILKGYGF